MNEQLGSEKPDGVHAHIAGKTEDGIRVIEVWDSTDAIERYLQAGLGDAMQQANLPEPTITDFEVHSFDWTGLGGSPPSHLTRHSEEGQRSEGALRGSVTARRGTLGRPWLASSQVRMSLA